MYVDREELVCMEARREYRHRLIALEDSLLRAGDGYRTLLARAVDVMLSGHPERAQEVVLTDDALDGLAAYIRDESIELIALQSPVAGELRVLSAILHVDMLLERLGELAINVARSAGGKDPDASTTLMIQIGEMGVAVDRLLSRSLEGFARRRGETELLLASDDDIDALRHRLQTRLIDTARAEPDKTEWAIRMALAVTALERAGDLAVAISRQTDFVVSGLTPRRVPNRD